MKVTCALMVAVLDAKPKISKEEIFFAPPSVFEGPNTERRYKDLHAIVLHYNPEFDHRKFWYYGCHCLMLSDRAMSTRGSGKPVDELDSLCKLYKECVHCAKMEFGEDCIPEAVKYNWDVNPNNNRVRSKGNPPGTCKRALYECDNMYATKLAESGAMASFTTDYHGYWTTTGFDYKTDCPARGGKSVPACCGGDESPFYLYNTLNENKKCCADGTIQKSCPAK